MSLKKKQLILFLFHNIRYLHFTLFFILLSIFIFFFVFNFIFHFFFISNLIFHFVFSFHFIFSFRFQFLFYLILKNVSDYAFNLLVFLEFLVKKKSKLHLQCYLFFKLTLQP